MGVVMQEMLHLALATNLLTAIGAPPHFSRPNFPILSGWYPDGVQIALVPFGERALRHFIYLERPEGMELDDAEGFAALDHAGHWCTTADLMAEPQPWQTVGQLYRGIEAGFGTWWSATASTRCSSARVATRLAGRRSSGRRSRRSSTSTHAQRAIDHIVEQGEGVRGDWQTAHFGIFVDVLDEYRDMRDADPSFEPARNVVPGVRPRAGRRGCAGGDDRGPDDGAVSPTSSTRRTRWRSRRSRVTSCTSTEVESAGGHAGTRGEAADVARACVPSGSR